MSPELEARFARVRAFVGQNAARYAHLKPVWAGLRLYLDYDAAAKMTRDEPEATVIRLAHRHHVAVHPIATYRGKPVVKKSRQSQRRTVAIMPRRRGAGHRVRQRQRRPRCGGMVPR